MKFLGTVLLLWGLICYSASSSTAQNLFRLRPGNSLFTKIYDIDGCLDGGALITGYKDSLSGNYTRPFIAKLGCFGAVEWSRSVSPLSYTGTYDGEGIASLELPDSSLIWMYRSAEQSATLSRLSSTGSHIWTTRISGFTDDILGSLTYLPTGYIAFTAIASGNNAGVAMLDLNGNLQWFRKIGLNNRKLLGQEIIAGSNGNIIVAGSYQNTGNTQAGAWVGIMDSLGNLISHQTYFHNNGAHPRMIRTRSGDLMLSLRGNSTTYPGKYNMLLSRLDSSLAPKWTYAYEHPDGLYALSLVENEHENLLLTGELGTGSQSRMFTARTDATGYMLSSEELQAGGLPSGIEHMRITEGPQGRFWASGGRHILRTDSLLTICQAIPLSLGLDSIIIFALNMPSATIETFATVSTPSQTWYDPGFVSIQVCSVPCQLNPVAFVSNSIVCPGDSIFFNNTTVGNYDFVWKKDGLVFAVTRDAGLLASDPGTHSVWLIVQDGLCLDSLELSYTVDSVPQVSINSAGPFCDNDPPQVLVGSPAGGGFSGFGTVGNLFFPAAAGIGMHTVTYTFTTAAGCIDTAETTITVDLCTGGTILPETTDLRVFPNPSSGIFRIPLLEGIEEAELGVVDVQGRVWKIETDFNNGILDLRALPDGIYVLRVRKGPYDFTRRLLKRH